MPKQKCENCKFHIGDGGRMWCARHAPIVMANPAYNEVGDHRISLSVQPETYDEACCGDFEEKENA